MKTTKKYRDAGTGNYVTEEYAKANPKTTVSETVKSEDDYIPFGEEWEKEVMKMTKKQLIKLLKDALVKTLN